MEGQKHLYDGYKCDLCKNKGYIMKVVDNDGLCEIVQSTCVCEKSRKSIRNLKASGLENVLNDYKFENYIAEYDWQKGVLEKAKTFVKDEGTNWFFMGGQSGSGKTHLCSAIAIELLRKGIEVKYMLWKSESRKIKNDNFDGGNLIEFYKNVEVLYIDDLFKVGKSYGEDMQRPTAGDINIAFEIINSRVAQKKKTIISSESTLLELFDIDEAVAGRIKQMSGEYCLNIAKGEGKNYRKKGIK
jgi:DNA replication protein DnaC